MFKVLLFLSTYIEEKVQGFTIPSLQEEEKNLIQKKTLPEANPLVSSSLEIDTGYRVYIQLFFLIATFFLLI